MIEIPVTSGAIGFGSKTVGLGLTVSESVFLQVRYCPGATVTNYLLGNQLRVGSARGNFGFTRIGIPWFKVDPKKYPLFVRQGGLNGCTVGIKISGLVVGRGRADLHLSIISEDGDEDVLVKKVDLKVLDFAIDSLQIRGVLVRKSAGVLNSCVVM